MHGRRSPSPLLAAALTTLLAVVTAGARAQDPAGAPAAPQHRRSIGLALSGGGARGGAHIGVLKALEELRVPVDYLAGTSIGAVVGGFYAAGMTVPDLEKLVESLEWERAFLNVTPRELKSFRRKRDDDLFLVDQKPGLVDGEFKLPAGLVQGQVIDTILSRETLRASEVHDFDKLLVPFRAVAGDIATGEAVVLRSGNLARSLRASMSIPAALAPIEIDGRLLVDGGIVMNLPVDVARQMGADVVIAVDISSTLLTRDTLRSVLDVTTQLTNLLTRAGTLEQRKRLRDGDILVRPEFSDDLNSVSFARMREAIQAGYDAIMAHREQFEPLALSEADYAAYLAARHDPRMRELPVVDFVRLDNKGPVADSIVQTRLNDIRIGQPLDVDAVERAINKVYGLEYYQNVRYGLVNDADGKTGLEVELDKRSWGPNYLQLGMEYSSAGKGDALFGLAASYLGTAINDRGGEWRATLVVGDEPALLTNLYQPLGPKGLFFVAPSLDLESKQFNVYQNGDRLLEAQQRQGMLELAAGRELPSWGEFRFGIREASGSYELRVGDPAYMPDEHFRVGQFFGRFSVDTMDSVSFPRSGTLASLEWRGSRRGPLSADSDFDQVLVSAAHAKTWGRHTILTSLRYDETVSGVAPVDSLFRMGGFFDLSGISRNELAGQHAVRIGASYYRRIGDLALFPAFAGVTLEVGNVWQSRGDISLNSSIVGGSFWAGVSTPVGPVYVGYGRAEGGLDAFYISLGRVF
ncbi:MAG TPA: patatin-like phospholipase family protein [Gammaproteobacteria bacterium]|jgi:NTE family protein|nr:patatin-like phospholipase family protein [Gammaproteobacteria bacterium]